MSAPRIAVVDYGMGNRRSVEKALDRVGARAEVTRDLSALRDAEGLVVPGVGAFPRAMANLRELELDVLIEQRIAAGVPVLGICLGLQLLFASSTESDGASGLGLLSGEVRALRASQLKLPHIGWALVRFTRDSQLTDGLPDECAFYHVHSYVACPRAEDDVLGRSEYGEPFVSAVEQGTLFGVQFHPEKSSSHGLRLLSNFARICSGSRSRLASRT